MDDGYQDFGDTDTEPSDDEDMGLIDSDDEDQEENVRLLKMLTPSSTRRSQTIIENFESEMEAELDQRALEVEKLGGVVHQKKSLSRSSSSSSLNSLGSRSKKSPTKPSTSSSMSNMSISIPKLKKAVRFDDNKNTKTEVEGGDVLKRKKVDDGEQYDPIYFDSDESEGSGEDEKKTRKKKRIVKTDDDLFYDPTSDTRDQEWIDERRRQQQGEFKLKQQQQKVLSSKSNSNSNANSNANNQSTSTPKPSVPTSQNSTTTNLAPLPNSDAVLNCPACFTLLCLDCQRHSFYQGQYRAMFVTNCLVVRDETMQIPIKEKKPVKRKKNTAYLQSTTSGAGCDSEITSEKDSFHPVKCKICNTQVGAYDQDEIFHFFNVLSSHA